MSKAKEAVRRYLDTIDKAGPAKTKQKNRAVSASPFPTTERNVVVSCLPVIGKAKSLQAMDAAIKIGGKKRIHKAS